MKKGEIWAVELPEGKGHEQKGERPALVLGRANALTIIVPFNTIGDLITRRLGRYSFILILVSGFYEQD